MEKLGIFLNKIKVKKKGFTVKAKLGLKSSLPLKIGHWRK